MAQWINMLAVLTGLGPQGPKEGTKSSESSYDLHTYAKMELGRLSSSKVGWE